MKVVIVGCELIIARVIAMALPWSIAFDQVNPRHVSPRKRRSL
jgi:hypothetical protein